MNEYAKDWLQIAKAYKDIAGWKCEVCKHPHHPASGHTLTVHHRNMDKADNSEKNLIALCQRCHLRRHALGHLDDDSQLQFGFMKEGGDVLAKDIRY